MAESAGKDDLSPSEFIKKIRELGEKKDAEDAERMATLERDILKGREERMARRAERARSISPEKSASNTSSVVDKSDTTAPTPQTTVDTKRMADDASASPSSTSSRSGTLSWQQRPKSRDGRRPLSMIAAENAARSPRATPEPGKEDNQEPSRAQIAESLASKDPTWFRQTADRGMGSAAYRRSQEELGDTGAGSGKMRLPGMSRDSTAEADDATSPPPDSGRSTSPSRASSARGSAVWSSRYSNTTTTSDAGSLRIRSPPPSIMDAPKLDPPASDRKPPLTGRPPSPTKGMGGFVESAMMKRADSVSKRWSQQPATGISRQSSSASNRSSYVGPLTGVGGTASLPRLDRASSSLSRDNSLEPGSRPTSSHSNMTVTQSVDDSAAGADRDVFVKPALPLHSRSKSVASLRSLDHASAEPSPPTSPSKRWSPTKSSWLESALTKTEDKPKPTHRTTPSQPSWMSEINKAKQQRSSSPIKVPSKPTSPEPIKPAFVPRESPVQPMPSTAKPKSPPPEPSKATLLRRGSPVQSSPAVAKSKSPPPEPAAKPLGLSKDKPEPFPKSKSPSPVSSPTSSIRSVDTVKSAPGKFDFRSTLKSRQAQSDNGGQKEPEFMGALGKLKRAQTEKYVAPDTLKQNILRGKAGLSLTGGPPKRERVDELKESLIKQKAAMQAKATSGEVPKRPEKPADAPSTPEALVKRKVLHRSQSSKDITTPVKAESSSTPEAIARMKSLKERQKLDPPQKPVGPPVKPSPSPPAKLASNPPVKLAPSPPGDKPKVPTSMEATLVRGLSREANPSKPPDRSTVTKPEHPDDKSQPQPFALPGISKPGLSSKLADRFNPGLAGMLTRGPLPMGKSSGGSNGDATAGQSSKTQSEMPPSSSEPLEHKTKGRAKGPKRRAPTKQVEGPSSAKSSEIVTPRMIIPLSGSSSAPRQASNEAVSETGSLPGVIASSGWPLRDDVPDIQPSRALQQFASVHNVSLVKPKDVLPSSPKENKSSGRGPKAASEELLEKTISTPSKPKPLAPVKSPLLVEKQLAQNDPENVSPEQFRFPLPPKAQVPRSRTPLEEQKKNDLPKIIEPITSAMKARPLPPTPSETKPTSARNTPPASTMAESSKTAFTTSAGPTPPPSGLKDSPAPSETATPSVSVRNATTLWGRQAEPTSLSPGRPKSPVKLPTKRDEEKAMKEAGLRGPPEVPAAARKPLGLGLGISEPTSSIASLGSKTGDRSPSKFPLSPPLSAGTATLSNSARTTPTIKENEQSNDQTLKQPSAQASAPSGSPIPHTSEAARLFADFFDERPVMTPADELDTMSVMESYPLSFGKVTTVRKQLQEITSDGKLTVVPSYQEHILFEESMYVCTHIFTSAKGAKSTEVYLWAGSGVPPAAVEDAQLFGRKVAKENSGKLVVLQQGKESPNFLQALGGILIIFRGSRSKTPRGIPNKFVLCGRRHLGAICFDEVDFTLLSFCSGFPYLISTDSRLYLWKGIGCHQEELSSARLITMDVSPDPNLTEIEEGREPESFFSLFPLLPKHPKNTVPRSADHWRLKARNEKYRCRLFRVEQHQARQSLQVSNFFSTIARRPSWSSLSPLKSTFSPTSDEQPKTPTTPRSPARLAGTPLSPSSITTKMVEVAPFAQEDLQPESIYVLDAFFEVYIIIGALAQSQTHAFSTALFFTQDYGILAASLEDRPFVPISTVVLEGVPRDLKPCFRTWTDEKWGGGTEALMAGKPKRVGSLRCVGLAAALAATRN